MGQRQSDGNSLRTHLEAMAARGHIDERLTPSPIPPEVQGLFSTFFLLSAARRSGMSAQPLTFTDIDAWARLTESRLTPWELETLLAMDAAAIAAIHPPKP